MGSRWLGGQVGRRGAEVTKLRAGGEREGSKEDVEKADFTCWVIDRLVVFGREVSQRGCGYGDDGVGRRHVKGLMERIWNGGNGEAIIG